MTFFALAFGWTWLWQAPLVFGYEGGLWMLLVGVGAIGPSLAAIVLSRGAVIRTLRPRGGLGWYVVALLVPPGVRALALGLDAAVGAELPQTLLALPFMGAVLLPPIAEELGWRGFAYPRLADRMGRLRAALVVSFFWALWHLPTALWPGAQLGDFPLYFIGVLASGLWVSWMYERANRSTLIAVLAHMSLNAGLITHASRGSFAVAWICVGVVAALMLSRDGAPKPLAPVTASSSSS